MVQQHKLLLDAWMQHFEQAYQPKLLSTSTRARVDCNTSESGGSCTPPSSNYAIPDSGSTGNFLAKNSHCINKRIATNPIQVRVADGHINQSSHTCNVDIPQLPQAAMEGHIVPGLQTHSLLSVSKICDSNCEVHFKKDRCNIIQNNTTILSRPRDPSTTLWKISINPNAEKQINDNTFNQQANLAHNQCSSTIPECMQFLHLLSFNPKSSSWIKGIKNQQYVTYPNLT
eukprot:1825035-Ditylum_brightwellii.AAC.1